MVGDARGTAPAPLRPGSGSGPDGCPVPAQGFENWDTGRLGQSRMKHATSRLLFSYWDGLRGERPAPERSEIEPGDIRHLLAEMFILEVSRTRSAEFRLAGTRLCSLFGRELARTPFDALWGEGAHEVPSLVDPVARDGAGVVAGLLGRSVRGNEATLELLLLPLRHRGRTSVRMLGALSCGVVPVWAGMDPVAHLRTTSTRILQPSERVGLLDPHEAALERRRRLKVVEGGLAPSLS